MNTAQEIKDIIAEKVTGVWQAAHDETGHKYIHTPTGVLKKSVTTKLSILSKPHLISWAVKVSAEWLLNEPSRLDRIQEERSRDDIIKGMQFAHTDIRDSAGSIGTDSHNGAEKYIIEWIKTGKRPKDIVSFMRDGCDTRSIAAARAIEAWFTKSDAVPIASEILVGNKYSAGTLDLLYLDKAGKLCLGDFKTSNAIDQTNYSLQIAAYRYMFQEMTGLKVKDCKILLLSKDMDKFTVYKVNFLPKAYRAFKQICGIYDFVYECKGKIVRDVKRIKI